MTNGGLLKGICSATVELRKEDSCIVMAADFEEDSNQRRGKYHA